MFTERSRPLILGGIFISFNSLTDFLSKTIGEYKKNTWRLSQNIYLYLVNVSNDFRSSYMTHMFAG